MATIYETDDAPNSLGTRYSVAPGDIFRGTLTSSDVDLVRIELTAGTTYEFSLIGRVQGDPLDYPDLRLFDADIEKVADNAGYSPDNLDAGFKFTPEISGSYYMGVWGTGGESGDYELRVVESVPDPQPDFAPYDEIAHQLTDGYWEWSGVSRRSFDYGVPASINSGNTVYGANSNVGGYLGEPFAVVAGENSNPDVYAGGPIALTILDTGGTDTFDLHADVNDQRVDLNPEGISDVYGLTGNPIVARDTVIENCIAGTGDDSMTGNSADNPLEGGQDDDDALYGDEGSDRLYGGGGDDELTGGTGNDLLHGALGNDVFDFARGHGHDVIIGFTDGEDRIDVSRLDLNGVLNLNATLIRRPSPPRSYRRGRRHHRPPGVRARRPRCRGLSLLKTLSLRDAALERGTT